MGRLTGRLDSAWWASSRAQATLHFLPRPRECPPATGRDRLEGGRSGPQPQPWGAPNPGLGGDGGGGHCLGGGGEPRPLCRSQCPPQGFPEGSVEMGVSRERNSGWELSRVWGCEHPDLLGPGFFAHLGWYPARGVRAPCPVWRWCPTPFSHQPFFSGCTTLAAPGGRPGGRAHSTCTGVWTHTHICVRTCVCVCACFNKVPPVLLDGRAWPLSFVTGLHCLQMLLGAQLLTGQWDRTGPAPRGLRV